MCLDSMTLVNVNLLSSEGQQLVQGEVNGEEVGDVALVIPVPRWIVIVLRSMLRNFLKRNLDCTNIEKRLF